MTNPAGGDDEHEKDIAVACPVKTCKAGRGKECVGANRRALVIAGHPVVHYSRRLKRLELGAPK